MQTTPDIDSGQDRRRTSECLAIFAWCPTYKVMDRVYHLTKSVVILIEWPDARFDGWAELAGAYNVLAGGVMESGLSEGGLEILGQVTFAGYKGWHDSIAQRTTLACLNDLTAGNGYNRELVLAYARMHRSGSGAGRLEKILDKFETQPSPAGN